MPTHADLYAAQSELESAYLSALRRAHALAIVRVYEETFYQIDDLPQDERLERLTKAIAMMRNFAAGKLGLNDLPASSRQDRRGDDPRLR
jgi:hypothetical protein